MAVLPQWQESEYSPEHYRTGRFGASGCTAALRPDPVDTEWTTAGRLPGRFAVSSSAAWRLNWYWVVDSVELATAYLNPSPQVNAHANQLPDLFRSPTRNPDPCPTTKQAKPRSSNGRPWALNRRLTNADRTAIVSKYQAGVRQKALAEKYGISLSSIKRLVREAC